MKLGNCYLAIVAICHQTSPIGERKLEGFIENRKKHGWDYLKEKFIYHANRNDNLTSPIFWAGLTPEVLADLYEDSIIGRTLNRVSERSFMINDIGNTMIKYGYSYIEEAFVDCYKMISGKSGFLKFLRKFEAYKDPVCKKSLFFLSIMVNTCNWEISDQDNLISPVDYHELRGHLRIGTVIISDPILRSKLYNGIPFTVGEDVELRRIVQNINNAISKACNITSSELHYFLWNFFRSCCQRDPSKVFCEKPEFKNFPSSYSGVLENFVSCIFFEICHSAKREKKISEPPHIGHFY